MTAFLRHVRALASRYALAVAVCQAAVLSASTIVTAASPHGGALRITADEACSCDHTAGVMCPMHKRSSRPAPTNAPRWCTGVDDSAYALLPALGALALPERVVPHVPVITESTASASRTEPPRPLDRPPDSPPPRA